jgi:hypothetical protein
MKTVVMTFQHYSLHGRLYTMGSPEWRDMCDWYHLQTLTELLTKSGCTILGILFVNNK